MNLTQKQLAFIDEYLYDLNATRAALRAGYNPNSAHVSGYKNLRNPEIARRIREELYEMRRRPGRMRDAAIIGLAKIADADQTPIHLKIKAYMSIHTIALAMEKIMMQKEKDIGDNFERSERLAQQHNDYFYRKEHAMEEYEKEQAEEEQELAEMANQDQQMQKYLEQLDAETSEPRTNPGDHPKQNQEKMKQEEEPEEYQEEKPEEDPEENSTGRLLPFPAHRLPNARQPRSVDPCNAQPSDPTCDMLPNPSGNNTHGFKPAPKTPRFSDPRDPSPSTYDWQSRMKEYTDPEAWKKETEEWEKLEQSPKPFRLKETEQRQE